MEMENDIHLCKTKTYSGDFFTFRLLMTTHTPIRTGHPCGGLCSLTSDKATSYVEA